MALKKRSDGFTLVELMIALIAGAFAVAGVYYLNGVSSRAFSQQLQVADTQMSLRSAMEQLRRDIARAGYLGAPNTRTLSDCTGAVASSEPSDVAQRWIPALQVGSGGSLSYEPGLNTEVAALLGTPATNKVRADDLTLWGNYATADAYLSDPTRNTSNTIYLQATSEAFWRSFYTPAANNGAATFNQTLFESTFAVGRMVRIEHAGRYYFRDITASNGTTASAPFITIAPDLPACVEVTGWMAVAPLMRIHYGLESDQTADFSRVRAHQADQTDATKLLPGSRRTILVRRVESALPRVGQDKPVPVAGTASMVLDYAVEFGIDAVVNTAATPQTDRPVWSYALGAAINNAQPERMRSLVVTLAARSAEADLRLPAMPRKTWDVANTLNSPLLTFQVLDPNNPTLVMNARVRTLRSEIFLQNL